MHYIDYSYEACNLISLCTRKEIGSIGTMVNTGIRSKCPKTKTSQVICQNVPFLVSQNVPSIFSLYLIKLEIANIFCEHTGQNVPKSNRPKSKHPKVKTSHSQNVPESKRPRVKTSQVKTSHSQNVPESKRPKLKCPKSKCPKSKRPKVKTSQVKTSHLVGLPVNNITHTVMKFLVYTSNMLYYSDNLLSTSL